MDCVDDSEPVPVWQNSIIAKVTRIGLEDDESDEEFAGAGVSREESNVSAASVHSTTQPKPRVTETASTQSMHSSDSLLGAFDDHPAPAPAASAASSVHSNSENLLDVDSHHKIPPAPTSGGSLFDMDNLGSQRSSGANSPASEHNDLLNMAAPTHPSNHGGPMPVQPMQQQGRPPQQAPMQGQYPMQYPPQGQYSQQRMPQQQQQQQRNQQPTLNGSASNAFDNFSGNSLDPLGSLNWNMK